MLPRQCFFLFSALASNIVHAVKVPLESVDMGGPESSKRSQPRVQFHKRLRSYAVKAALRIHCRLHKSCLAQYAEVF